MNFKKAIDNMAKPWYCINVAKMAKTEVVK